MDIIIGLAMLFAIGWAVSKSKVLSGLLNGIGLAMNWLWGSLFIGGGIWGLISGWGIWIPLLCIAVGIYFFTTGRFDKKVEDAAQVLVEALSDKVADRLSSEMSPAPNVTAGDTYDGSGAPSAPKRPSLKLVLLIIGVVGVAYGVWGLQSAGEVTTTYNVGGATPSDYGVTSTSDVDMGGPLPWLALLGGGASLAVAGAFERRERRARSLGDQGLQEEQLPQPARLPSLRLRSVTSLVSRLDRKTKIVLGVCAAVVVLLVAGPAITNSVRAARDHRLEGAYARGEAEYLAQVEAKNNTAQDAPEAGVDGGGAGSKPDAAVEGDLSQEDTASEGATPNGHRRWMQLPDILPLAPADGSTSRADVTFTASGGDAGTFILEVNDTAIGGNDATYVHDVQLFEGEMGEYYVDGELVGLSGFYDFLGKAVETKGSIEFNQGSIVRSNAYSNAYLPEGGH